MGHPGLFLFISVLFKHNSTEKTVSFSGIWTQFDGVDGEHADHSTTTTAHQIKILYNIMTHQLLNMLSNK